MNTIRESAPHIIRHVLDASAGTTMPRPRQSRSAGRTRRPPVATFPKTGRFSRMVARLLR